MKKICLIALIFFAACKKPTDDVMSNVDILVKDAANSQPVSGATVMLRRCANAGCAFGEVTEFQGTTDANGICHVPGKNYSNVPNWNNAIYVLKENYQPQFFGKSTTVSIMPYGWMAMKITAGSSYPQGSKLIFLVEGASQSSYMDAQRFNAATDSTIILRGWGNQQNKVHWQVTNSVVLNSGDWNQEVPRLDTVKNITLNY